MTIVYKYHGKYHGDLKNIGLQLEHMTCMLQRVAEAIEEQNSIMTDVPLGKGDDQHDRLEH